MRVRLIVRLLDENGALLAWAALRAIMRGDGCLRATEPCALHPLTTGVARELVLHWPDLNIQKREACELRLVVGTPVVYQWDVVWTLPTDVGVLPAVTVNESVSVGVPTGGIGAVVP
jgi:hypothetical protein